jgi:thioredoxin 1
VRDVTDSDFDDVVLRAGGAAVVDFWAPWCGPCKAVEPVLAELAEERPDVAFVKLDVDANPRTASRYGVLSLPTVIVFDRGRARETVVGARPRSHYAQALARGAERT